MGDRVSVGCRAGGLLVRCMRTAVAFKGTCVRVCRYGLGSKRG